MDMLWMILVWAVCGLIVGAIARLLVPGRQSMSLLMTMVLGIVGAFVGGGIASLFTDRDPFHWAGWLMSILGAVIVVWIYAAMTRRPHAHV